jgi:hypothetical protein
MFQRIFAAPSGGGTKVIEVIGFERQIAGLNRTVRAAAQQRGVIGQSRRGVKT